MPIEFRHFDRCMPIEICPARIELGSVECRFFLVFILCTIAVFFCIESTLYVFRPIFVFLPCDHGLDFDIIVCENSTNQSKSIVIMTSRLFKEKSERI